MAAAGVFVSKGYGKATMGDLADAAGLTDKDLKARFSSKDELAAQAFKLGRQSMEMTSQKMTGALMISDYLSQVFDGLVASTAPWGPDGYFEIFYQATKNNELRGLVKKASEDTMLILRFYINDMIDHDLISERIRPDIMAEEFLTKFIENLAMLSQGRKIEEIKQDWIEDASSTLAQGAEEKIEK